LTTILIGKSGNTPLATKTNKNTTKLDTNKITKFDKTVKINKNPIKNAKIRLSSKEIQSEINKEISFFISGIFSQIFNLFLYFINFLNKSQN
jgi:hypothetical protein